MAITLQIMLDAPTHNIDSSIDNSARNKRGDICAVYLTSEVGVTNPDNPMGFIHITDEPDKAYEKIKERLTSPIRNEVILDRPILRKRKWRILASAIPISARNRLLTDREITVTWNQVKPYIRKKIIISQSNPALDDEIIILTDEDIT